MSINSTTSTETPSTVRAVSSGDHEDLSKSQEDLLTHDNASVASGNRYIFKDFFNASSTFC